MSGVSFSGTYGVGYTSVQCAKEDDVNAVITATDGSFSGTANENLVFVPTSNQNFGGGFSAGNNGRFTGTVSTNATTAGCAFYFVDSTNAILVQTDGDRVTLGSIRQQVAP